MYEYREFPVKTTCGAYSIGDLREHSHEGEVFTLRCTQGWVRILFYTPEILRIVMNPLEAPSLKSSPGCIGQPQSVPVTMKNDEDSLTLSSPRLKVIIKKAPLQISAMDAQGRIVFQDGVGLAHTKEGSVWCTHTSEEQDHIYGLGEKTGFLDKRGERWSMWNTDVFPHLPNTDRLYQSIPFFMLLRHGRAHGIFLDNTFETIFDFKNPKQCTFGAMGGQMDYYVLLGPTPREVVEQYTTLTGRMPLPPKWSLGYHQSRYSYETEAEIREVAQNFREREIPLDVIHFDIHYMNGYRVFTFDQERFPGVQTLLEDLKEEGIRAVPIVDPGIKKDAEYRIYREGVERGLFCRYLDGQIYHGTVWPGISAFPDFTSGKTRTWWGENLSFYTGLGIEGIWNDMNEPAVFNETKTMDPEVMHENDGDPKTHRELHNLYGFHMGQATYAGLSDLLGKRPFILTRAGYAGIQRYAAVWTGDNHSYWEHLQMSLPMCMNLGLSGVAFCGSDVGGFTYNTTPELLARWTQVGAFIPFFRNHSTYGSDHQEPWVFGEEIEAIVRKYIGLRYIWLPHLYTLIWEASQTGAPVMRPLVFEYPQDPEVATLYDQFLFGSDVLIAPIMQPGRSHRVVYLPQGDWVDYWTGQTHQGNQHILVKADLETLPLFIKAGAILSHGQVKASTQVPDEVREIHLYWAPQGTFTASLYEDDGESWGYQKGQYLLKQFEATYTGDQVSVQITDLVSGYTPTWKQMDLIFHGLPQGATCMLNGRKVSLNPGEKGTQTISM